jgi:hypothetical protein
VYEYKVVEIREKMMGGKMSGPKLEQLLNENAGQGWRLRAPGNRESPEMRANVTSVASAATREAMPPARRPGWQSIPVPVVPGFLPGDPGGDPPGGARVQVALLEVNAPVAA